MTELEKVLRKAVKEYKDCNDRLFLNVNALIKMPNSKKIKELIKKDQELKEKLETVLNLN